MPVSEPQLSIITSLGDGPRPATNRWWNSSREAKPTQNIPAVRVSHIPRTPYTYKGNATVTARRKYSEK